MDIVATVTRAGRRVLVALQTATVAKTCMEVGLRRGLVTTVIWDALDDRSSTCFCCHIMRQLSRESVCWILDNTLEYRL